MKKSLRSALARHLTRARSARPAGEPGQRAPQAKNFCDFGVKVTKNGKKIRFARAPRAPPLRRRHRCAAARRCAGPAAPAATEYLPPTRTHVRGSRDAPHAALRGGAARTRGGRLQRRGRRAQPLARGGRVAAGGGRRTACCSRRPPEASSVQPPVRGSGAGGTPSRQQLCESAEASGGSQHGR